MTAKEKRLEKKRKLKAMFDAEYDETGNGDYFESLKKDLGEQAEVSYIFYEVITKFSIYIYETKPVDCYRCIIIIIIIIIIFFFFFFFFFVES